MRFAPLFFFFFFFLVAKRCVSHLLFFLFFVFNFIFNFGLNWPVGCQYRQFRPIQTKSARISLIQRKSAQVYATSAQVMKKKKKKKKSWVWHRHVGSGVPYMSPRRAASDAGAAPLAPCPCFPDYITI